MKRLTASAITASAAAPLRAMPPSAHSTRAVTGSKFGISDDGETAGKAASCAISSRRELHGIVDGIIHAHDHMRHAQQMLQAIGHQRGHLDHRLTFDQSRSELPRNRERDADGSDQRAPQPRPSASRDRFDSQTHSARLRR